MNALPTATERKVITIGVGTILLGLIATEASFFGSGRLLMVGPLTVKMWLFFFAQAYVIFRLFGSLRVKLSSIIILLSFALLLSFATLVGIARQTTLQLIGADLSPLLYCFFLLFAEMTILTKWHVQLVMRIIEISAMIMSLILLVLTTLIIMGTLNFLVVYRLFTQMSGDTSFRGGSGFIFYKGAVYIGVSLIYFVFRKGWSSKVWVLALTLALLATSTRGFIVGIGAAVLVHAFTGNLSVRKRLIYLGIMIAAVLFLFSTAALSNRTGSDQVRVITAEEVWNNMEPASLIFGNGFGIGVPIRPGHMEITYLEILQKQGLIGLIWWGTICLLITLRYYKARRINYALAQPLFLSFIFLFVISATNPFIATPIGTFIWIVTFVGLDVLSRNDQSAVSPTQHAQLAF